MNDLRCPFCPSTNVQLDSDAFIEIGEFDGSYYEIEGDVKGYLCENGHRFYAWDSLGTDPDRGGEDA